MTRGRIIYEDLAAGRLTMRGLSRGELRDLMRYALSLPPSNQADDVLAAAMVEIVQRFMSKDDDAGGEG